MRHLPVTLKTLALCLLCTGWTLVATLDLKGDPDLDGSYGQQTVVKQLRFPHDIDDKDLDSNPFDELDNYVEKMVKHLDDNKQKGDPDEMSESHFSKHNHYVNYPVALHPHHRQKRFLKGIVKGISKGIKGVTRFVGGIGKGLLNIGGMLFGRPQAVAAAGGYDQSMRFSLLQLCNEICVTEWTMWTPCSKACGGGIQERTRENQLPGQCSSLKDFTCQKSTKQQRACNEQCPNGGLPNEAGCACQPGWSGTCCHTQNVCPYPGKPSNGKLSGTFPAKYRAVAQFECNPGYSLDGDEVMHCQEDGTWRGTKPTCRSITCRGQPANEHVRVLNPQPSYLFGEEVIYRCEEGYVLDGPTARKCMGQGRLSGFNPLCRAVKCEDPGSPVNGHRVLNDLRFSGIANFTCNDGFKLVGPQSMRCLASGNWLGRVPTCEEIKCDPPFPPRNGGIQLRNARFGATVVFECDDGYELLGNTSLRCMSDGYWNGIEPKCKAINCGNPGIPDHGSKDGSQYTYPHKVTFRCFNGYRLVGADEIECQQDATWTSAIPTCEACPLNTYMDDLRNPGNCIPCGENMYTTSVGSTHKQNCLCNEGFNGPPGGPCIRIECPPISAPVNGQISECSRTLESTCSFTCNPGYVLDRGTPTRTCQNNAQWDGSEAFCAPCPENTYKSDERSCLPCPDNSFTNDTLANVLQGCVCQLGYTGNPGGPCVDVNECTEDGGTTGPCEQTCENRDGGYMCGCSIPGYVISDDQHTCRVEKQCQNLTRDDAPLNGGLVCHWYHEENSQQCGVRCNHGYEFPSRVNDYEYCGPVTGYTWSFKRDDPDALIPPCIEQFFPDLILLAETSYFVRACDDLTDEEKVEVKQHFISVLNENKICENRQTKVCSIDNVDIICGHRTVRRRKRGVEEELSSVDFKFNVSAIKLEENKLLDKDKLCTMLKIPGDYCTDKFVTDVYRNYLKAALMYAGRELKKLYKDTAKLLRLRFEAAQRDFEPEEDGAKTSETKDRCPRGMQFISDICVPCFAGSYYDDDTATCKICLPGTYQMLRNQTYCDLCPNGTTSTNTNNHTGPTFCRECNDDRHGQFCEQMCDCGHGKCNPIDGTCMCDPGWEGEKCNADIQGCVTGSCFEGVTCSDVPAPGTGFTCGPCPTGYHGDGATCVPIGQPLPANTAITFNS